MKHNLRQVSARQKIWWIKTLKTFCTRALAFAESFGLTAMTVKFVSDTGDKLPVSLSKTGTLTMSSDPVSATKQDTARTRDMQYCIYSTALWFWMHSITSLLRYAKENLHARIYVPSILTLLYRSVTLFHIFTIFRKR